MEKVGHLTALFSLLAFSCVIIECRDNYDQKQTHDDFHNVYYVEPILNETHCPSQPCKPIANYLEDSHFSLHSDSIITFLPGIHLFDTVIIDGVSNITLQGTNSEAGSMPATLECNGNENARGLLFVNVSNLVLKDILITNCSKLHYSVIYVWNSTNVSISGVTVTHSNYGIFVQDVSGDFTIKQSTLQATYQQLFVELIESKAECTINSSSETLFITIHDVHAIGVYGTEQMRPGLIIQHRLSCQHSDIVINNLHIEASRMYINIIEYKTAVYNLLVNNSFIHNGVYRSGGALSIVVVNNDCADLSMINVVNSIKIQSTTIETNSATLLVPGGLFLNFTSLCRQTIVTLENLILRGNYGSPLAPGGNLFISEDVKTQSGVNVKYIITNCVIQDSTSTSAPGIWFQINYRYGNQGSLSKISNNKVLIQNTTFINNTVKRGNGGGLDFVVFIPTHSNNLYQQNSMSAKTVNIQLQDCTFLQNQGIQHGSAVSIVGSRQSKYLYYNFTFENVTIREQSSLSLIAKVGAVYVESVDQVNFINCMFLYNNNTALFAFDSKVFLIGTVHFIGNTGFNGGAMALCSESYIYFTPDSQISFIDNHAEHAGGAIYAQSDCFLSNVASCFYRVATSAQEVPFINLEFKGNTANFAGDAIYGGQIEDCSDDSLTKENDGNKNLFKKVFSELANVSRCSSMISSDPILVRFCSDKDSCPMTDLLKKPVSTYPGKMFSVSVATLGQLYGFVPGAVRATVSQSSTVIDNNSQIVKHGGCTIVNYTISSKPGNIRIELEAEQPEGSYIDSSSSPKQSFVTIEVKLEECPPGFAWKEQQQACACDFILEQFGAECNINDETIKPPSGIWIGYYNASQSNALINSSSGVLMHPHCPFHYCNQPSPSVKMNSLNNQCSTNRAGILCGQCQKGFSMVFGASSCDRCSHNGYIALVLVFVLCGLVLVFFLRVTHMTVSHATVNGLLFYANIVHANYSTFFPNDMHTSYLFPIFLAWINLDFGIKTCFYQGMDTYAKIWLQFIFPFYVWTLITVMIAIGYYSTGRIARVIIGQNGVQVLATLFLLSYTKFQRIIIDSFSFTYLKYPDNSTIAVWLLDGNIQYLHGKHIPLFIAALVALVVLIIPFTVLVTFAQWIQKVLNRYKPGRVVNSRLWVFHDAYSGKYKDKFRFWTGLLLLARTFLLLVFAFNVSGDPNINLLAIGLTSSCLLLVFCSASGGMYKQMPLNLIETSFFFNLLLLSLCTLYARTNQGGSEKAVIYTSCSVAFFTFIGVLLYHLIRYPFNRIYTRMKKLYSSHTRRGSDVSMETNIVGPVEETGCTSVEYSFNEQGDLEIVTIQESDIDKELP